MKYRVLHTTTYLYSAMVSVCHNAVHLAPRNTPHQRCLKTQLDVTPTPARTAERLDIFGNNATFFAIQERHQKLEVSALSEVEVDSYSAPMPGVTPAWEDVRDGLMGENARHQLDAVQFLYESPYIAVNPELPKYTLASFTPRRPVMEAARELTQRIHTDFKYDNKATSNNTSVAEAFAMRRGVCQDFAHVEIACLRSIGLAARYVSGYLMTTPPPGQPKLVGGDASHAWLSFYCPGFDWIDVDPTNDAVTSDKHILLAWGRDYGDVNPTKGVILGGGKHSIRVSVDVRPMM